MNKIRILQLGNRDLQKIYKIADIAEWFYEPDLEELKADKKEFDMAVIDRNLAMGEKEILSGKVKPYCLFYTEQGRPEKDSPAAVLSLEKKGRVIPEQELEAFLLEEPKNYFAKPYGEKTGPGMIAVSPKFHGKVEWNGFQGVYLDGEYGRNFSQIVYWRYNLGISRGQTLELWLEFEKDSSVELQFQAFLNPVGQVGAAFETWTFTGEELQNLMYIESKNTDGSLFVFLQAKGSGKLHITALHNRHSRRGRGCFLPGGERIVSSEREEAFFYFNPGDRKPPLNIYFSGYKTLEGFEGYYMMRNLGCPFLLISESRLEGGAFYLGSAEYEKKICDQIREYMEELGFSGDQVIASGLSMGTFGALYYSCDIHPKAVILGKPLASLGDIAKNERIRRPGGFPTSLDVLKKYSGGLTDTEASALNRRFWDKFAGTNWKNTIFASAYMLEDDYDGTAYEKMKSYLDGEGVLIYGKGIHGRHNDNTSGIVNWFVSQYHEILKENFNRNVGD